MSRREALGLNMRAGSICSGAGGLDLAIEAALGARTVWQTEIDPHASLVLEERFGVPNHGDISTVDWSTVEPVDVLSGGTPCQDMSPAGKRAGMTADTRSGLWSHMATAISILRPSVVVWENVQGALNARATSNSDVEPGAGPVGDGSGGPVLRAAGRVLGDLASFGYDAAWEVVSAAEVGACHRRNRVFVVAVAADADGERFGESTRGASPQEAGPESGDVVGDHLRARPVLDGRSGVGDMLPTPRTSDQNGAGAHGSGGLGLRTAIHLLPTPTARDVKGPNQRGDGTCLTGALLPTPTAGDSAGSRGHLHDGVTPYPSSSGVTLTDAENDARWGRYSDAVARHAVMVGRPAPNPTVPSRTGSPVLSHRFTEWMMGWPEGWVSDVLDRRPGLRVCGNGVVPQQAEHAIKRLLPFLAS